MRMRQLSPVRRGLLRRHLPGDRISDPWALTDFEGGVYHLHLHGPNGSLPRISRHTDDPLLTITLNTTGHAGCVWSIMTAPRGYGPYY